MTFSRRHRTPVAPDEIGGWMVGATGVDTGSCATTSAARGGHVTGIEPTAHLVAEFSDSDATALPWSEVVRILESSEMFWLSTVRRDGRPHVAPLPAMWLDGKLHFCTGAHEQKAKNIEASPRCVLTTGTNSYRSGLD